MPQPKVGRRNSPQSTQRFIIANSPLGVLSVSVVNYPKSGESGIHRRGAEFTWFDRSRGLTAGFLDGLQFRARRGITTSGILLAAHPERCWKAAPRGNLRSPPSHTPLLHA